jgi:hypothetical protein
VALMDSRQKFDPRRYAYVALIVAGLAAVSAAVTGLIIGLVKLQMFAVADVEKWRTAAWVSLAFVVIGIAVFGIIDPDRVRRYLTGRRSDMAQYAGPHDCCGDSCHGKCVGLPKSEVDRLNGRQVRTDGRDASGAKRAAEKVRVAFFSPRTLDCYGGGTAPNFKINSGWQVRLSVRRSGQRSDSGARWASLAGKIMLVMGSKKEIAAYADGPELARTLIRLISPEARVIYFLTGHGEANIADAGDASMTIAKSTLEGKNYTVNPLNLLAENNVPEDAQAIVIAGPAKQLSSQEVSLLKQYLANGGGLVVMENHLALTDFGKRLIQSEYSLRIGIQLDNDIVIDLTNAGNELYAISLAFLSPDHPINDAGSYPSPGA